MDVFPIIPAFGKIESDPNLRGSRWVTVLLSLSATYLVFWEGEDIGQFLVPARLVYQRLVTNSLTGVNMQPPLLCLGVHLSPHVVCPVQHISCFEAHSATKQREHIRPLATSSTACFWEEQTYFCVKPAFHKPLVLDIWNIITFPASLY